MNRGGAAATTWTVRGDGDGRRYRVGFPRSRFESWTFYTGSSLGHSYPPGRERGSLHRDSPVIDCLCLQKCWTHGRGAPSQSRRFCDNKEVLRVVTRLYDRRCRIFNWDAHGYAPLCGIEAACTALAPCCSTRARTAGGAYARNDDHIRDNFLQRPSVLSAAATWIVLWWIAAAPRPRRGEFVEAGRGGAAAATWIFHESRRGRGRDVESSRRRVAAPPRPRRRVLILLRTSGRGHWPMLQT